VAKGANSIDKHVGTRLRVRRMMLGMSQTDIGDALGTASPGALRSAPAAT
jgi:hypothetical protein